MFTISLHRQVISTRFRTYFGYTFLKEMFTKKRNIRYLNLIEFYCSSYDITMVIQNCISVYYRIKQIKS